MKIEIINNLDDLKKIKVIWDKLFLSLRNKSVFQTFDYNFYAYSNCLDFKFNSLSVGLIYDKDLISICPFYIDRNKKLRFINDVHSDICDILCTEIFDFDAYLNELFLNNKIRSCHLININEQSFLSKYNSNKYKIVVDFRFASFSFLNIVKGNFPNNLHHYKSKQKTEIRRILKKYSDMYHSIINYENCNFPKSDILILKNKMIKKGIRSKNFINDFQIKFLESLFNLGILHISLVKSNNHVHALSLLLKQKNNYVIWIDIYDSNKLINLFNYISLITLISKENSILINFGRGIYNYKIANFLPEIKSLLSVRIFDSYFKKFTFIFKHYVVQLLTKFYKFFK